MIRIAIVEDEKQQYEILNSYLQRYGAENGETFDVRYFLDAVEFVSDYRYDFDLIFMDIMMPDLDGMKAAEKLRAIDGKVPLIFVTNMAQYAIQGYSVSARYFLLKPVNYDDFAIKMKDTLLYIKKEQSNAFLILDIPYEKRKIYEKD
ncbi:MAG: LytR/AlgR family response regulator transcription factor, partial [Candidatus Coproplasma sp.]